MSAHPLSLLLCLSTGVFLLTFAFVSIPRLSAARRHLIWHVSFAVVAACSPLVLLNFQIPVAILPSAAVETARADVAGIRGESRVEMPVLQVASESMTVAVPRGTTGIPWGPLLWTVWTCGVIVTSGRLLLGYCKLQRVFRRSPFIGFCTPEGNFAPELKAGIPIHSSREVGSPMTIGIRSPAILIPECLVEHSAPHLHSVLLHEAAHARMSDVGFLLIAGLTRSLHWFNPLVWIAAIQLKATAELAADDAALHASTSAEDYAASLLAVVRLLRQPDGQLFPAVRMAGRAEVSRRVTRLLNKNLDRSVPSSSARRLALLAFVACGMAGFATRPVAAEPRDVDQKSTQSTSNTEPDPSSQQPALDEPQIEIEFKLLEVTPETYSRNQTLFDKALESSSEESFHDFLRSLNKLEGVDLLSAPKVTMKSRQNATIQVSREFRFPAKFDDEGAPMEFETRDLGVTFEAEPRAVNDKVVVSGTLRLTDFLGFVDGETKTPAFQTREARIYREFKEGEVAVMLVPWQVRDMTLASRFEKPSTAKENEPVSQRLLLILKAALAPTKIRLPKDRGEKHLANLLETTRLKERKHEQASITDIVAGMLGEVMDADGDHVAITWDSLLDGETPKASFQAGGMTAKEVLGEVEKQTGITHHLEGSMLVIGTRERLATRKQKANANRLYATPVPMKPGFVTSPHAPTAGQVDVRGYPPGASVTCPYSGKMFLVP